MLKKLTHRHAAKETSKQQVPTGQESQLAAGLEGLTLDGHDSQTAKQPRRDAHPPAHSVPPHNQPVPIGPTNDPYSEAIADRNLTHPEQSHETYPEPSERIGKSKEDGHRPLAVEGYALGRTEDSETIVTQAPAVTHETRIVNTHEVVHEQITREIHHHHVFHRVQPIDVIEVLPPRHFARHGSGKGYVEIPPPESSRGMQERVKEAFESAAAEKRAEQRKAVRPIMVESNQHREWTSEDGVKHSETLWVHAPQLETAARDAGETVPLHIDRPKAKREGKAPMSTGR